MDAEAWVQLNRLLDEALDVSPEQRAEWLAGLGSDDRVFRTRLAALLAHAPSVEASAFLSTLPGLDVTRAGSIDEPVDQPGATVGAYRLLREVGEGGMGTVWLAERTDGIVRRPVALKLPRGAWPRLGLFERMAREREILASLAHPNIARLYDAGVTPNGRPYLALEYVDGRPIDEYCRRQQLDVHARLRVFLQVVRAVAYAHARLIVHRDLKPSNILVTADGDVRLLDFGVAKLLEPESRQTALTAIAGRPHTPEYASPEQIADEPIGIGTDIYSLGVVLFELLTRRRPYRLEGDSRRLLEDAILRAAPRAPSATADEPAERRMLRGDLDTIVLKALKKKPDDRYPTVNAFGDDLQRYLDGRPVVARPDSAWYRCSKFVGRNRIAVAAAAVVVVSLAAFAGVSAWQARVLADERRVAQVERDTSEQVVRVLIDLFETTNPSVRPDGDRMPLGEFLSGAQARSLDALSAAPAVRARLQQVFGLIHYTRGQLTQARTALEDALEEQRRLRGPDHPEALESLQTLGEVAHLAGDDERARALMEESLDRHRRVYGDRHERTARVLFAYAPVVYGRDIEEARVLLVRALDIRRAALGPNHPLVGENLAALGGYYYRRLDYERAKDFFGQALAVFPRPHGRRNPIAITILNDFALVHVQLNLHGEAEALQREGIDLGRQVLGPETMTVGNLVNNLGATQSTLGRHADAERSFRDAFETHRSLLGEDHPRTRNVARNVGRSLAMQERYADALPWMDRAVGADAGTRLADTGDPGIRAQRARVLFRLGRREEALKEGSAAVEAVERLTVADKSRPFAFTRLLLGRTLNEMGRPGEADRVLSLALGYYEAMGPEQPQRAEMMCELARARARQGGGAENSERLKQCLPIYRAWGLAEPEVVADLERLANRPGT